MRTLSTAKPGPWRAPWYRAVNWGVALDWACAAALIICLVYLGIFVFTPFTFKIVGE
jgi:hypothetical protein